MKRKQDIEQLFRDQQYKLDERPSARAWDQLESRLNAHQRQRRHIRPRFPLLSLAASLLLLVSMVVLISIIFRNSADNQMASNEAMSAPTMEVLNPYKDQKGVYTIAVNYQRYLNQSPRLSFTEGPENKRLLSPDQSEMVNDGLLAQAQKKRNSVSSSEKKMAPTKEAASTASADQARATSPIAATLSDQTTGYSYDEVETYAAEDAFSMEDEVPAASKAESAAPAAAKSKESSVEQYNAGANVLRYNGTANPESIEPFQWLIGQWQGDLDANRQTVEEWQQTDAFTIEGKGQLVINGDTTFTEGMKIQKIGDNLYFIIALDQNQQEVKFRLRSYQPPLAVFETEGSAVPNQLILQQNTPNNFTTTLQNAVSTELNQNQLQYLQNRNHVELDQQSTTRSMSRVRK